MKQSPQISARINEIAKELASGKERGYILRKYAKKWGLSRTSLDRYITSAKPRARSMADLKEKTMKDVIVRETTEAVNRGLRSKLERVLTLQDQCKQIEDELIANVTIDYIVISGNMKRVAKEISVTDRAYLRNIHKSIQAEISKIEGDYDATKHKHTIEMKAPAEMTQEERKTELERIRERFKK